MVDDPAKIIENILRRARHYFVVLGERFREIHGYLDDIRGYETIGGLIANYKNLLVDLRDSIMLSISSAAETAMEAGSKEHYSRGLQFLFEALDPVNKEIEIVDQIRTISNDADAMIDKGKYVQRLASLLMSNQKMIALDIATMTFVKK